MTPCDKYIPSRIKPVTVNMAQYLSSKLVAKPNELGL